VEKLAKQERSDAGTARQAVDVLRKRPTWKPFFLWVHFFGPHAPSGTHAGVKKFGDSESDKYDHEIANVDRQVGTILRAIDSIQERPTVVVLTSDHGERFYNARSRGHGRDVAEDSIRIPLFVRAPDLAPGTSDELVSLVDIFPTVLGLTQTPAPRHADGVDLTKPIPERTLFLDTFVRNQEGDGFKIDLAVALRGKFKVVRDRVKQTLEFNERSDRGYPAKNLLPKAPAPTLVDDLDRYLESTGGPPRVAAP
jgi:arylsulfatase A-like enzyme